MNHNRNDYGHQISAALVATSLLAGPPNLNGWFHMPNGRMDKRVPENLTKLRGFSFCWLRSRVFQSCYGRRLTVCLIAAKSVPIYFALPQTETTVVSAAIEFLNTFLLQYIAYRRDEPDLCRASLTLNDLVKLAPASDLVWIEELVEAYNRPQAVRRRR